SLLGFTAERRRFVALASDQGRDDRHRRGTPAQDCLAHDQSRHARNVPTLAYAPVVPSHHAIDYIELSVTDIDAAKRFYAAAFGWSFNDYGPTYAGFVAPGKDGEAGGLRRVDQVAR